jgi:hypothetical protein
MGRRMNWSSQLYVESIKCETADAVRESRQQTASAAPSWLADNGLRTREASDPLMKMAL